MNQNALVYEGTLLTTLRVHEIINIADFQSKFYHLLQDNTFIFSFNNDLYAFCNKKIQAKLQVKDPIYAIEIGTYLLIICENATYILHTVTYLLMHYNINFSSDLRCVGQQGGDIIIKDKEVYYALNTKLNTVHIISGEDDFMFATEDVIYYFSYLTGAYQTIGKYLCDIPHTQFNNYFIIRTSMIGGRSCFAIICSTLHLLALVRFTYGMEETTILSIDMNYHSIMITIANDKRYIGVVSRNNYITLTPSDATINPISMIKSARNTK